MLLTKLIPPRSEELKDALNVFNRFLEEPHSNPNEKLELIIVGGRGCGKSTMASGMLLKANAETGACGFSMRKELNQAAKWNCEQMVWSCETVGVKDKYSIEFSHRQMRNKKSRSCICFRGIDEGIHQLMLKVKGIPKRRFLWIDEAQEIESEFEYQETVDAIDLRENPIIILTANPCIRASHWLNRYVDEIYKNNGKNNRWVFKPCFMDMEKEMLGESFFRTANELRKENGKMFAHRFFGIPME